MEEKQDTSLKDEIKRLNDSLQGLDQKKKEKAFKLKKKLSKGDLKKNVVLGIIVGENKEFRTEKLTVEDGTVSVNKIPRIVSSEHLGTYQGKPAVIIYEPVAEAINFKQVWEKARDEKLLAVGYRLILNRMEAGVIKAKKQIKGWIVFAGLIALIVVGYLLLKP